MSYIWAIIVGTIVLLVIYGVVSSRLDNRKRRLARSRLLPYVNETVRAGHRYDVQMSDGRVFRDVELEGTNDPESGQFALGGWEGMLVLRQSTGKRVFVRQASVRSLEER